jgi:hypothetical protein
MMEIRAAARPRWRRIVYLAAALAGVAAGLVIGWAFRPVAVAVTRPVPFPPARQALVPVTPPVPGRIPADARVVTVTPVFPLNADTGREWAGPTVTITDPAKVAQIVAVINALPQLPSGVYDCPFGNGSPRQLSSMQLTFRTAPGGPMVASLTAAYANCQHVWINVGGQVWWLGDYTTSGQDLQQQVLAIADVRWP